MLPWYPQKFDVQISAHSQGMDSTRSSSSRLTAQEGDHEAEHGEFVSRLDGEGPLRGVRKSVDHMVKVGKSFPVEVANSTFIPEGSAISRFEVAASTAREYWCVRREAEAPVPKCPIPAPPCMRHLSISTFLGQLSHLHISIPRLGKVLAFPLLLERGMLKCLDRIPPLIIVVSPSKSCCLVPTEADQISSKI